MMPDKTLTEHLVSDDSASIERKVWALPTLDERPTAALIFLDAELYLERVQAPAVVRRLQEQGLLPSVASVFVSNSGAAARHVDFTCHPGYAAFIADDVAAWVRQRFPSVTEIVLVGLSLSGLAAAYITSRFPQTFRIGICQSPSFWWEQGRFPREVPTTQGQSLWICVGDQETEANVSHPPSGLFQGMTQLDACDQACAALRTQGYRIQDRTYHGGHDPACWRDDLTLALPWACRLDAEGEPHPFAVFFPSER